jgi:TatD DNase family protein
MTFSDSHCHLERYEPELLAQVLKEATAKQVSTILTMSMTVESSKKTIALAESRPGVQAAIGIHPWNAGPLSGELRQQLLELARTKGVAAIGEIGLDYVKNPQTKEAQRDVLAYQLSLARETGLPVSVHCKEAHADMMDIFRKAGSGIRGTVHGFNGDLAMLKDWLDLGFLVGIGLRDLVINPTPALEAMVREIPSDRLLTETDSAPGGNSPSPAGARLVVERLATLRNSTPEGIGNAATANLKRLLGL